MHGRPISVQVNPTINVQLPQMPVAPSPAVVVFEGSGGPPLVARAAYFLLVGWWASAIWLAVAWCLVAISVPTLGLPLAPAFLMFEQVLQVLTQRND